MRTLLTLLTLAALTGAAAAQTSSLLPNGLSVIGIENRACDVCAIHVALDIGPDRVPDSKAGLRALIQQILLAKIRDTINTTEGLEELRREGTQGASFAIETQWDDVEFVVTVTSDQLARMLEFVAPAVFAADWTPDDVVNAKELIIRKTLDNEDTEAGLYQDAFQLFQKALSGDSPRSRPIFGTEETLGAITLADIKSFYRSYYVPNLASVCVVAPYPESEIQQMIGRHFGGYEQRDVRPAQPDEARAAGPSVQTGLSPKMPTAVVVVGVPLPPVGTDGHVIGEVLHAALSGPQGSFGRDASLSASLPLADRITSRGGAPYGVMPIPMSRSPYLSVFARSLPTAVESARQAILSKILNFASEPMSDLELKRAKTRAINQHTLALSSPQSAAIFANRYRILTGQLPGDGEFAQRVSALTPDEILAFAKDQFSRHAIGVVMPGT